MELIMEITKTYQEYIASLKQEVVQCRMKAILSVNKELILLYWRIGKKILEMQEKEGWGSKIIQQISKDLKAAFPDMKGLGERNLKYMRRFAYEWQDIQIVQQVAAQIPWTHNCILLDKVHAHNVRLWYINKTIENGWSRSVLALQIESKLYERQGNEAKKISNFKATLPPAQSDLAHSLMKDPYNFEFLGIGEEADEKEIEKRLEQQVTKLLSIGLMICHTVYHFYVARLKPKRGRGAYTSYVTEPETCSFKM
jgi:predicted nuclease of restriction endonuclease-like (RecB) superfamily